MCGLVFFKPSLMYARVGHGELRYSWWIAGSIIQAESINISSFLFVFIILCFVDEFKRIVFLRTSRNNVLHHTEKCIDCFKSLQKGFGTAFLFIFFVYQTQNIFCIYNMCISLFMSTHENLWNNIVLFICYITMSLYLMTVLYCVTLTADEAYEALQSLNVPLEKMLVNENDFARKEKINITMRKLEKIRPLNGNGYFNITRETLTSIVSTTVTYLIILLQFR